MRNITIHRCFPLLLVLALLLQTIPSVMASEGAAIADIDSPCVAAYTVSEYPDEAVLKSSFPDTIRMILTTGETAEIPVTWYCADSYGEETQPFGGVG